jgi:hypothetical protein
MRINVARSAAYFRSVTSFSSARVIFKWTLSTQTHKETHAHQGIQQSCNTRRLQNPQSGRVEFRIRKTRVLRSRRSQLTESNRSANRPADSTVKRWKISDSSSASRTTDWRARARTGEETAKGSFASRLDVDAPRSTAHDDEDENGDHNTHRRAVVERLLDFDLGSAGRPGGSFTTIFRVHHRRADRS